MTTNLYTCMGIFWIPVFTGMTSWRLPGEL